MDDAHTNEAASSYKTSISSSHEWLELTDPAELVSGCPVCFLTTVNANGHTNGSTIISASGEQSTASPSSPQPPKHNVMVISWLTPVTSGNNNSTEDGLILLSMNRRRHTASVLLAEITKGNAASFGLSIPTSSSMARKEDTASSFTTEDLLANVGKTSGRWGRSKFPGDYADRNYGDASLVATPTSDCKDNNVADIKNKTRPNKKSRQARKREQFARGVPHLKRTMLGSDSSSADSSNCEEKDRENSNDTNDNNGFAVDGTIAHLQCQVMHLEEKPVIDDDHYYIVAKITKAFVKSSHWDVDRRVFCYNTSKTDSTEDPQSRHHFLSFFGSRRFGYVSASEAPQSTDQSATYRELNIKDTDASPHSWHVLTDGKQWSRLLYTNPLCLMSRDTNMGGKGHSDPSRILVLPRLTATNNTGSFMFSLQQSVATELKLLVDAEDPLDDTNMAFSLSVPVQGMEGLVQQFLRCEPMIEEGAVIANHALSWESIPLAPKPDDNDTHTHEGRKSPEPQLKYIVGCVAFMECHVYRTAPIPAPSNTTTDETDNLGTHVTVFAKVDRAFVHPSYWNDRQSWFLPATTDGVSPYMKYLGSGTFGYILPTSNSTI